MHVLCINLLLQRADRLMIHELLLLLSTCDVIFCQL